jgi:hypothetical protein
LDIYHIIQVLPGPVALNQTHLSGTESPMATHNSIYIDGKLALCIPYSKYDTIYRDTIRLFNYSTTQVKTLVLPCLPCEAFKISLFD